VAESAGTTPELSTRASFDSGSSAEASHVTMQPIVAGATVAILLVCYASILRGMFEQWWQDEDMGHAFLVPFVILWIIWRERKRWMEVPVKPSWWGVTLLATAACIHLMSATGAGLFVGAIAFVLSAVGAVLCLGGVALLRSWAFPFLLTLFMLPKLAILYYQLTLPLQLLASRIAEFTLVAGGTLVKRDGNIIDAGGRQIEVAAACSGIRYILTLSFVAVVFAYFADAKPWMRTALLAASVPVAILANALRIAVVAWTPALDSESLHALAGCLIFIPCLAAIAIVHRLLNAAWTRRHV
jgi:exosortase